MTKGGIELKLFEFVLKEFISIVTLLLESEPVENDRIIIEREHFKKLLEKYQYMKFADKTKIYKDLNFILHDKNNFTLPCKDMVTKKTVRKVVINYNTYQTVKRLYDIEIDL